MASLISFTYLDMVFTCLRRKVSKKDHTLLQKNDSLKGEKNEVL